MTRNEIDRLAETSPPIPRHLRDAFRKRFDNLSGVAKPSEANGLHAIQIYVEEPRPILRSSSSNINVEDFNSDKL